MCLNKASLHQSAPLLSPVILLRTTLAYRTRPNCENSSFSSSSFTTNGRLLESDYSVGSRESVCVCVCVCVCVLIHLQWEIAGE